MAIAQLVFAVFIVSWGSILVRWMGPVDPLVISFYRLFLSILVLIPVYKLQTPKNWLPALRPRRATLLAGLFLALHFVSWISSVQMTTVGRSIFLESTHPVFAVFLSAFFLRERAPAYFIVPLLLALGGMYLTVHGDITGSRAALGGDLLALFSALCLAAYLLIARWVRSQIDLLPYLIQVYALAAGILLVFILMKGAALSGYPVSTWLLMFALAFGPNLIGHSLLNRASRYIPVYRVNSALLAESILATAMAWILLGETPDAIFLAGAALILVSIIRIFYKEAKTNT